MEAQNLSLQESSPSDNSPKNPNAAANAGAEPELKKLSVLVVDDETDLREIIAFDLKRKGHTVMTAGGGHEAWKILSEGHSFHLIVTDIKMPLGDGLELLQNIVKHQPELPVICLTGFAELSPDEILKLGAKAIFEKPFDRKKFHAAIAEFNSLNSKK